MKKNLLEKLDILISEVDDMSEVMERMETFRTFNRWLQERHAAGDVVCEVNKYEDMLSIDMQGVIIKADSLLQIRFIDKKNDAEDAAEQGI